MGTGHRPPAGHQVVLFERHIQDEPKVRKRLAYRTGGPQITLPAGRLAGKRVVIDQVLMDQFTRCYFVALAPDLVQPAVVCLDKHLRMMPSALLSALSLSSRRCPANGPLTGFTKVREVPMPVSGPFARTGSQSSSFTVRVNLLAERIGSGAVSKCSNQGDLCPGGAGPYGQRRSTLAATGQQRVSPAQRRGPPGHAPSRVR